MHLDSSNVSSTDISMRSTSKRCLSITPSDAIEERQSLYDTEEGNDVSPVRVRPYHQSKYPHLLGTKVTLSYCPRNPNSDISPGIEATSILLQWTLESRKLKLRYPAGYQGPSEHLCLGFDGDSSVIPAALILVQCFSDSNITISFRL